MNIKSFYLTAILSLIISGLQAETIHQWEVYTISFKSGKIYSNPYQDIPASGEGDLLKVSFLGTGGDALNKQITVTGFWNGGSEWRVNFASPLTGTWKYTSSSADRKLNGKRGSLEVIAWSEEDKNSNPTRHGLIEVRNDGENAGHYFEYSDGQPVLWIGDTWWNWTDRRIYPESFKKLEDDRSSKGFENTTYNYEGAVSMKHLAAFFRNVRWWNMKPHPELVREYPQPFCLAQPGEEYVVYLRYAGVFKIRMDELATSRKYSFQWYDPASGKFTDAKTIQGSDLMEFSCPESYPAFPEYKDWVLYISRL